MRNIEIMFHDGIIGPRAGLLALSALTTGNLNSKLQKGAKPYSIKDVLPSAVDYIYPPLSPEEQREQANRSLLAFLAQSPGAEKHLEVANDNRR